MSKAPEEGIWVSPATRESCERAGRISHMDVFYRRADTVISRDVAQKLADALSDVANDGFRDAQWQKQADAALEACEAARDA